jgi:serine/threonine protein kinase
MFRMQKSGEVLNGEAGRYRLIEEVGKGGFGTTYRAENVDTGGFVAVKELRFDRIEDWKAVELFDREAQTLAALDHPSIPEYVDNFVLQNQGGPPRFVLVQEFVEGVTLDDVVRSSRELDEADMERWFRQILEVCDYLHGLSPPVIHRDIAPKNIVIREDGAAFLIDFGTVQARVLKEGDVGSTSAGTFGYAAMEQFVGRAVPASDLYSLAMTFLAVRAGVGPETMPFDGNRVDVDATLTGAPIDGALAQLLKRMTEPDPRARPQSAQEVLDALDAEPPAAQPRPAPSPDQAQTSEPADGVIAIDVIRDGALLRTETFGRDVVKIGTLSTAHVRLDDSAAARLHAVIERSQEGLTVIDLGSEAGTHLNGRQITKADLHSGDELRVGNTRLRVRYGSSTGRAQALVHAPPTSLQPGGQPRATASVVVMVVISLALFAMGLIMALVLI